MEVRCPTAARHLSAAITVAVVLPEGLEIFPIAHNWRMGTGPDRIVSEFKRRRSATWRATRWWWAILLLGVIGFEIPFWINRDKGQCRGSWLSGWHCTLSLEDETIGQFTLGLVSFIAIGAATIGVTYGVRRHYRCPKCNEIPMGSWSSLGPGSFGIRFGVNMNPVQCPSCGAQLK